MSPSPKPRGRAPRPDRPEATSPEPRTPDVPPKARTAPHEVRIIGGQWKRSKLPVPHAPGLRPTPDRVRETLFNWLGRNLDGWRCLDAFAGSGALGFEAASRGASAVTLLEREAHLVRGLHASRERLKAQTLHIATADAITWMARCAEASFELIFIDPPFDASLFAPAMHAATRVVVPGGWVYLEADQEFATDAFAGLTRHRHGRAGAVHFHLFQRHEPV
jgi:16S rRNA (guanine966-N2)-methyltransferase